MRRVINRCFCVLEKSLWEKGCWDFEALDLHGLGLWLLFQDTLSGAIINTNNSSINT